MSESGVRTVAFSDVADFTNGYAFGPADWGTSGLPIVRIPQLLGKDAAEDLFDGPLSSRFRY